MRVSKRYDFDKIRELYRNGRSKREIAKELGYHYVSFNEWVNRNFHYLRKKISMIS